MEHIINAEGKTIGRVATQAAKLLLAKDSVSFAKNVIAKRIVRVQNTKKITIDERKLTQKTYHSHSGFPGSDKATKLQDLIAKKGVGAALKNAINGMLPKNTLREKRLLNLIIED